VIDCIHIEQLEIRARIGVPEPERAKPQRIVCNITLWLQQDLDLEDEIGNTVDYSKVAQSVKDLVSRSEVRLLETLAEKVAAHLITQFPMRKIRVEMRKFALPDAEFVSVTATQEAAVG
jgi:FolB domain-containing protein